MIAQLRRAICGGRGDFLFMKPMAFLQQAGWKGGAWLILVFMCAPVHALQVDDLDADKEWQTAAIAISGNARFSTGQLRSEMVTTTRSWYTPWRPRPHFDPVAFKTD